MYNFIVQLIQINVLVKSTRHTHSLSTKFVIYLDKIYNIFLCVRPRLFRKEIVEEFVVALIKCIFGKYVCMYDVFVRV